MSEFATALGGAKSSEGIATIAEVGVQGMITLRGDLGDAVLAKAVKAACGQSLPAPRTAEIKNDTGVAWMSPDELLILCPHATVNAVFEKVSKTLEDTHHLAVNVSAARASFRVEGPNAREVLAKLCPVDLSPDAFSPEMFRRTRMAQVPAAFWQVSSDAFQVICFRSQAQYVYDLLCVAAQPGSEVGL